MGLLIYSWVITAGWNCLIALNAHVYWHWYCLVYNWTRWGSFGSLSKRSLKKCRSTTVPHLHQFIRFKCGTSNMRSQDLRVFHLFSWLNMSFIHVLVSVWGKCNSMLFNVATSLHFEGLLETWIFFWQWWTYRRGRVQHHGEGSQLQDNGGGAAKPRAWAQRNLRLFLVFWIIST